MSPDRHSVSREVLLGRIDDLEQALAHALMQATTDQLTGVFNRRGWLAAIDREEARAARHGLTIAVSVVDLDRLKRINDTQGHDRGDELLRACADELVRASRSSDTVARLGGDEFGVLGTDIDRGRAAAMPSRLAAALAAAGIEGSVGGALTRAGLSAVEAWQLADQRMLEDKARRAATHGGRADDPAHVAPALERSTSP